MEAELDLFRGDEGYDSKAVLVRRRAFDDLVRHIERGRKFLGQLFLDPRPVPVIAFLDIIEFMPGEEELALLRLNETEIERFCRVEDENNVLERRAKSEISEGHPAVSYERRSGFERDHHRKWRRFAFSCFIGEDGCRQEPDEDSHDHSGDD